MNYPMIVMALAVLTAVLKLAWYVGVFVLLYKIWQKVQALPGGIGESR